MHRQCKVHGWRAWCVEVGGWLIPLLWLAGWVVAGWLTPSQWLARWVWIVRACTGSEVLGWWLRWCALGRSNSIRAGIVWASFEASFKEGIAQGLLRYMLSALPSISNSSFKRSCQNAHAAWKRTRFGDRTIWGIVLGGGPIVLHALHIPLELVVRFL